MRLVAVVLCAALFGLNAESALLHVHQGEAGAHHHHGPAAHQHKIKAPRAASRAALTEPDEDSTSIPAVLAKATTPHAHVVFAAATAVMTIDRPGMTFVPRLALAPRAHGPPPHRPGSPRAPPQSHLL